MLKHANGLRAKQHHKACWEGCALKTRLRHGFFLEAVPRGSFYFDADGNLKHQTEIKGLLRLLDPEFVESIQSWTRKNAASLIGHSLQLTEEVPYPTEALREVLANAVAHSSYHRDSGGIRIEMHPNRLVVRNVAPAENEAFLGKWFSRASHVKNRSLMTVLRMARLVDEAGNGKLKIFRHMMESGKPLPRAEGQKIDAQTVNWSITLYSHQPSPEVLNLIARVKTETPDPDVGRLQRLLFFCQTASGRRFWR